MCFFPTVNLELSTAANAKTVFGNDFDNDRQPEIVVWPPKPEILWNCGTDSIEIPNTAVLRKRMEYMLSPQIYSISYFLVGLGGHVAISGFRSFNSFSIYRHSLRYIGWNIRSDVLIFLQVMQKNTRLDCAQRAQTSAKTSNLNQKWSAIRIRIPGLIRIRIRCLPDHSQKCCGFITLLSSVILVVTMVYYTTPICIAPSRQANQKRCGRLRVIYGGEQSRL